MRIVSVVFSLALFLAVPLRAAESIPADLREAIRMRMDALAKVDIATWDRLTTDDFTTVLEDARLQTKAERMAQLKGETPQPPAKQLQQRLLATATSSSIVCSWRAACGSSPYGSRTLTAGARRRRR
jgi:hypothetical protein